MSEADLSSPVVMTLTANTDSNLPITLEVAEIRTARLARDNSLLLPLILIPSCVLLTVAVLLIVHRKSTTARRKKRLQERAHTKTTKKAAKTKPTPENKQ
jgi:hypothetical protein